MIYITMDTFYLTDEELKNSPSSKDGIDETTETTLRIYGCDLIQESGILLKLPQAVMATGQVLFHRFYCKKSFAQFNVKRVAASCVWLASKLEECPRKASQVLIVFHRMECRRENLPIKHLNIPSKRYVDMKAELTRTERHLLKEMAFICHVEHPHKFILNYLATLETSPEHRQEAWNLANDSLRTTLCVRFKSEVVACGVIYAAARRFQVPLPENPPWWKAFDADKSGINEVCRVLAHLYTLPKAQYLPVCKEGGSFATSNRTWDSPHHLVSKDCLLTTTNEDTSDTNGENQEASKELKKKSDDESKSTVDGDELREEPESKLVWDNKIESDGERMKERERGRERTRSTDRERGQDFGTKRGREDNDRDTDKISGNAHHSWNSGRLEKSKHQSTQGTEGESSQSTFSNTNEISGGEEDSVSQRLRTKRPMGRKAHKRAMKISMSEKFDDSHILKKLNEYDNQRKIEHQERMTLAFKHFENLKMEARRQVEIYEAYVSNQKARRQRKENERIMRIDLNDPMLNPHRCEYYRRMQKEIISKSSNF